MRPVVGAVHDEGVVGDAQLVQQVEQLADVPVVVDHCVVIRGLPAAGLPHTVRLGMGVGVHMGGIHPAEEGLIVGMLARDEILGRVDEFVIAGFHALGGQGARVLDALASHLAPAWLHRAVVLVAGPAVQHAARAVARLELGELLGIRVIGRFRLFFGIEVVQVTEELVKAVHRGQELVAVAQVVLAELPGRIAERLEQLGDGCILGPQSGGRARGADLRQAGSEHALAGDEGRTPGGARLLAIAVGKAHALIGDAVDVRRAVPHQAVRITAQVTDADVVAPDDQDVRPGALGCVCHFNLPLKKT